MRVHSKILLFSLAIALLATFAVAAEKPETARPSPKLTKAPEPKAPETARPSPKLTKAPEPKEPKKSRKSKASKSVKSPKKQTNANAVKMGQIAAVNNKKDFCWFLPPNRGDKISSNEHRAVAFCTNKRVLKDAPNANLFPKGFIQSANWAANTTKAREWVQVTGRFNPDLYGLSREDGGGQYDQVAPRGAQCAGYRYWVNFIEPNEGIYCMRCCKNKLDCPRNKSHKGCRSVLGGNFA
ncbi:hypothetical protein DFQ27_006275 [Actinomortierella ambigua]|uniref:Uncharacterized protein n=1 Tax=Actinomortierella ambigua TaxID=1343610 RepID=A0A9P6PYK0_9FUNG|nr:hypothetical protein DFQ27_006275 [Actinomortierella ambigua]